MMSQRIKMEENGSAETFIYFLIIAAIYFLNFFLKRAKKKREASTTLPPRRPATPPPAKRPPPMPVVKKVEVRRAPPRSYEAPKSRSAPSKPRIARIVGELPSKKNLILLSEILLPID